MYKLQHPGKELVFSDMKPPVSEAEQQGKPNEVEQKEIGRGRGRGGGGTGGEREGGREGGGRERERER